VSHHVGAPRRLCTELLTLTASDPRAVLRADAIEVSQRIEQRSRVRYPLALRRGQRASINPRLWLPSDSSTLSHLQVLAVVKRPARSAAGKALLGEQRVEGVRDAAPCGCT
jgi:hypothetical protein